MFKSMKKHATRVTQASVLTAFTLANAMAAVPTEVSDQLKGSAVDTAAIGMLAFLCILAAAGVKYWRRAL